MANVQDQIRLVAYRKWEKAGRPPGDGANFWCEAEKEVLKASIKVAAKTSSTQKNKKK